MTPLLSVIGGPMLVTHNSQTWRNTTASNIWAPGAYGWEIAA